LPRRRGKSISEEVPGREPWRLIQGEEEEESGEVGEKNKWKSGVRGGGVQD
jgi:hypothetical protein